jgi:hypothetical protein
MARTVEYRHLAACWSLLFCWLAAVCTVALSGRAGVATSLALAAACASGATTAGSISFRRTWRPLAPTAGSMISPLPGADVALRIAWPAIVAGICLSGWAFQARGLGLLMPSAFVLGGLAFWIRTGGVSVLLHQLFPTIVPPPQ